MSADPMLLYRSRKDACRIPLRNSYEILGFLSSGTYGRVYKARVRNNGELVAIKKFKPEKEGEAVTYTGISQSATREIMLNREISHVNVAKLREVMLEDKSIYMIFEYAEHDFLQIIHHHSTQRNTIPLATLKCMLYQLMNGVTYLHANWILHRDLKPANILVTNQGIVKIGDLGLARLYSNPLQPLYTSDKVVVTIWYRPPDLLLGAKHYTASVDVWSVGCIFGELIANRPMFKGDEAKADATTMTKKNNGVAFQRDQLNKIFEVMGTPTASRWPSIVQLPDYDQLARFNKYTNQLVKWFRDRMPRGCTDTAIDLISQLLTYDPNDRITAASAMLHPWWTEEPKVSLTAFPLNTYPLRRVSHDDTDKMMSTYADNGRKRSRID